MIYKTEEVDEGSYQEGKMEHSAKFCLDSKEVNFVILTTEMMRHTCTKLAWDHLISFDVKMSLFLSKGLSLQTSSLIGSGSSIVNEL